MLASLTALTSKLPALRRPGKWFYIAVLGLLLAGASIAWYLAIYTPAQAVTESALQTAAVRQGELTLAATGSGTLTATGLNWAAQGTATGVSGAECSFSFTDSSATPLTDGTIRIDYKGRVCGVPVSGSEVVRKK